MSVLGKYLKLDNLTETINLKSGEIALNVPIDADGWRKQWSSTFDAENITGRVAIIVKSLSTDPMVNSADMNLVKEDIAKICDGDKLEILMWFYESMGIVNEKVVSLLKNKDFHQGK